MEKETLIRKARKKLGLSLIALSHETRLHPSVLCQVERSKLVAAPRVKKVLCEFLGLDEKAAFLKNGLAA